MATIKISDLSVGDWVRYKGEECTIASIYMAAEGYPDEVALTHQGISCGWAYIDYLESVPITPEILEANGIHKTYECDEYAVYKGEGFSITEYYTDLWEFESRRNRVTIKRVHRLQHALRLAGVDKEINL